MEFEDILKDIGGYGKYQRNMMYFFMCPVSIFAPWFIMTNIFLVSVPDHWCYVPELDLSHLNVSMERRYISPENNPSCFMYNVSYENISNLEVSVNSETSFIPCNRGWSFDRTNYESTAATTWNLVCDKAHYPSLVLTLQNVGGIIGTPIYSIFSDKFGRKMMYFFVALVCAITNFVSPFAQSFSSFAVIRTLHGSIYPTICILPYILVMEIIPTDKRTFASYVWNFCWVSGMCILPLIVYLSRSWKILCWVDSVAAFIILLYWRYVPESPRWLVSQKRYEEAQEIMLNIAKKNQYTANTKNLLKNLQSLGEKMEIEEKEEKRHFSSFIKMPRLRKHFILLTFCCLANHAIYRSIHYNISNLEGNEFLVFFLLSVAEVPGCFILWFCMERFGRRWSAVVFFAMAGVVCAVPVTGLLYSDVISSILAKFIVAGLYMVVNQQELEIYPTVTRSFGVNNSKCIAMALAIGLPYIAYLSIYGKTIPFIFISFTSFCASIVASFLPETLNKNLPQTILDGEEFGKDQKYFTFKN